MRLPHLFLILLLTLFFPLVTIELSIIKGAIKHESIYSRIKNEFFRLAKPRGVGCSL